MKTNRDRALHHLIPHFSTYDRLASHFINFPPPMLYFFVNDLMLLNRKMCPCYKHVVMRVIREKRASSAK
jgi:hypothetical protein